MVLERAAYQSRQRLPVMDANVSNGHASGKLLTLWPAAPPAAFGFDSKLSQGPQTHRREPGCPAVPISRERKAQTRRRRRRCPAVSESRLGVEGADTPEGAKLSGRVGVTEDTPISVGKAARQPPKARSRNSRATVTAAKGESTRATGHSRQRREHSVATNKSGTRVMENPHDTDISVGCTAKQPPKARAR